MLTRCLHLFWDRHNCTKLTNKTEQQIYAKGQHSTTVHYICIMIILRLSWHFDGKSCSAWSCSWTPHPGQHCNYSGYLISMWWRWSFHHTFLSLPLGVAQMASLKPLLFWLYQWNSGSELGSGSSKYRSLQFTFSKIWETDRDSALHVFVYC